MKGVWKNRVYIIYIYLYNIFFCVSEKAIFKIPDSNGLDVSMSLAMTYSANEEMASLGYSQCEDCKPEIFSISDKNIFLQEKGAIVP